MPRWPRRSPTKPERVFHLAALFANQNSVEHPDRDLTVNGLGVVKVLEHAQRAGVAKVLYTSSSCVYGNKAVMRETDIDFKPDTPYAITKLLGEQYCRFWSEFHKLDTVMVRLFNTYGPGEHPGRYRNVIPNFMKLAMAGEALADHGTGEETRDFNFVADTVAGMILAMETPTTPARRVQSGERPRDDDQGAGRGDQRDHGQSRRARLQAAARVGSRADAARRYVEGRSGARLSARRSGCAKGSSARSRG